MFEYCYITLYLNIAKQI
ncbi:MAG: hypothetical protein CO124_01505, partial [Candidatus Huberarchaeum crystalense]